MMTACGAEQPAIYYDKSGLTRRLHAPYLSGDRVTLGIMTHKIILFDVALLMLASAPGVRSQSTNATCLSGSEWVRVSQRRYMGQY